MDQLNYKRNYINAWRLIRHPDSTQDLLSLVKLVGLVTGLAGDLRRQHGARRIIRLAEALLDLDLDPGLRISLHYNACNAHTILRHIFGSMDEHAWIWDHPQAPRELYHLRSASRHPAFCHTTLEFQCEIHVNTANVLSFLGRGLEAVEEWDKAIAIDRNFGMAIGNRGQGLETVARSFESDLDVAMYVRSAISDYRESQASDDVEFDVKCEWEKNLAALEDWLPDKWAAFDVDTIRCPDASADIKDDEFKYRSWCRLNRLFISHLNDIHGGVYCWSDSLSLPTFTTKFNEPPRIIGLFNQLKQEFASARYFAYQSIADDKPHFSDNDVLLVDTLDHPMYSLRVERLKAAYRAAFSVLNRISIFINWYFELGHRDDRISCKTVWLKRLKDNSELHPTFVGRPNLQLRGLYWLLLDVAGPDKARKQLLDPAMLDIQNIRNHLEHQYLKIVQIDTPDDQQGDAQHLLDTPTYIISFKDFSNKAITLLKIARSSILQLSQAVVIEERRREKYRAGVYAPVQLPNYTGPQD